jgi:acetyl esterase/lipase
MLMRRMFRKRMSIEEYRAFSGQGTRFSPPVPSGVEVHRFDADGISAAWISPFEADSNRVIVYFHGGGFVTGGIDSHLMMCSLMGQVLRIKVLVFDYRLAPEHPFPAALEDGLKMYRWLLKQGYQASDVIISGDSAGGGLALAVTLSLRDANEPLPSAVVCISPWVDLALTGGSHKTNAKADVILTTDVLTEWALAYTDESNLRNPLVSPLYADFNGFPPLFIQADADEILSDDAKRLANKAKADGVDATLKVWNGLWHVWHALGGLVPESKKAFEEIERFLNTRESKAGHAKLH